MGNRDSSGIDSRQKARRTSGSPPAVSNSRCRSARGVNAKRANATVKKRVAKKLIRSLRERNPGAKVSAAKTASPKSAPKAPVRDNEEKIAAISNNARHQNTHAIPARLTENSPVAFRRMEANPAAA